MAPPPSAVRSKRKPRGEGHVRRQEILRAAESIFITCGYEGATIRKIAQAAGLSSTALYMHFRDKSEMLLEISDNAFGRLLELVERAQAEEPSAERRLARMLGDYLGFGLENPNIYRLVFAAPSPPERSVETNEVGQILYRRMLALLSEIEGTVGLNAPVDVTAQLMWAGVHGMVSLLTTRPSFDWAPQDTLRSAMVAALTRACIRVPSQSRPQPALGR